MRFLVKSHRETNSTCLLKTLLLFERMLSTSLQGNFNWKLTHRLCTPRNEVWWMLTAYIAKLLSVSSHHGMHVLLTFPALRILFNAFAAFQMVKTIHKHEYIMKCYRALEARAIRDFIMKHYKLTFKSGGNSFDYAIERIFQRCTRSDHSFISPIAGRRVCFLCKSHTRTSTHTQTRAAVFFLAPIRILSNMTLVVLLQRSRVT